RPGCSRARAEDAAPSPSGTNPAGRLRPGRAAPRAGRDRAAPAPPWPARTELRPRPPRAGEARPGRLAPATGPPPILPALPPGREARRPAQEQPEPGVHDEQGVPV